MSEKHRDLIEETIDDFMLSRRASGKAKNTLDFYLSQLKFLSTYCFQEQLKYIDEVSARELRKLFIEMAETGHSEGGKDALWRSLKVFFRWYQKEIDYDPNFLNPMLKVERPNHKTDPIPGVPEVDFLQMLDTCDKSLLGQRNKALMMTMYDSGVRVSELCNLLAGDLDRTTGAIRIEHGKGDKPRTVFVGDKTLNEIVKYLRMRREVKNFEPLFAHKGGVRFEREGVAAVLIKAATEARITDVPSPHDFRRAFATQSLRNGANLMAVRDQLGHSTYTVVDRYAQLNTDDLRAQHKISSPMDRIKR